MCECAHCALANQSIDRVVSLQFIQYSWQPNSIKCAQSTVTIDCQFNHKNIILKCHADSRLHLSIYEPVVVDVLVIYGHRMCPHCITINSAAIIFTIGDLANIEIKKCSMSRHEQAISADYQCVNINLGGTSIIKVL